MKYPQWFDYCIESFHIDLGVEDMTEKINEELIKRSIDATDVISITLLEYADALAVFYKYRT